jgi:hypothetical protein
MPRSRAANRRRTRNIAVGITALVLFTATLAGVAWYLINRDSGLDRVTLCPKTGPKGQIVLLVDKTDPLNYTQKQAFLRLLEELVDHRVEPGYLVSVFVLGEDYREGGTPLVEICNPGSGEGKSELTANIEKLNRQFRDRFREPLLKQADALISTRPAKNSPIIEMLQLVSINGFRAHAVHGPKRLIVVSDMLHKTAQISMYQRLPEYDAYAESEYGRKTRTELPGVQVELHWILHYPKLQTSQLIDFWRQFFEHAGAKLSDVRPMEG